MNNKFLQLKALKQIIDEKKSFQSVLENIVRQNNLSENDKAGCVISINFNMKLPKNFQRLCPTMMKFT